MKISGLLLIVFLIVPLSSSKSSNFQTFTIASLDTYIDSATPDTPYGLYDGLFVGNYPTTTYYSLLRFTIPNANFSGITEATLELNVALYDQLFDINIHLVTSEWDESTTWNTMPNYDSGINTTFSLTSESVSVDITSIAQDWENNPSNNFGILLEAVVEDNYAIFSAREEINENLRPYLQLLVINFPEDPKNLFAILMVFVVSIIVICKKRFS